MFGRDYGDVGGDEIVGADEIIGADEIVGAPRLNAVRRVVHRVPTKARRLIAGIPATIVAAAAEATISVQPQQTFRTERVIVPSDIAFFFSVLDVKVGNRSQFVASGEVPAAMWTEVAIDAYVHWDTASIGNLITMLVSNIDVAAHTFRAALLGTAAID